MSDTLRWALRYADHGWPVFALSASKQPLALCEPCKAPEHRYSMAARATCQCLTCHSFYRATTDHDVIRAMFAPDARRCVAIRTGAPSGTAVVDVDMPAGREALWSLYDKGLPVTVTARTGSGGLHLIYAHPGGTTLSGAGKFGAGIDSKADGGYIVAPPSWHQKARAHYRWASNSPFGIPLAAMPDHLVQMIRPKIVDHTPRKVPTTPRGALTGLVKTVIEAPHGKRNDVLWWAAKRSGLDHLDGRYALDEVRAVLTEAALQVGLTSSETRNTIASGFGTVGAR